MDIIVSMTAYGILFMFLIILKCHDKQEAKKIFENAKNAENIQKYERYKYYSDVV